MLNTYNNDIQFLTEVLSEHELKFIANLGVEANKIDASITGLKEKGNAILKFSKLLGANNTNNISPEVTEASAEASYILELISDSIDKLTYLKSMLISLDKKIRELLAFSAIKDVSEEFGVEINKVESNYNNLYSSIECNNNQLYAFVRKLEFAGISLDALPNVNYNSSANDKKPAEYTQTEEFKNENRVLLISEIEKKVFLPYSEKDIAAFLKKQAHIYNSEQDVVQQEFVVPLEYYTKHPVIARFKESFQLLKNRENKNIFESVKFALSMMFKYNLNPAIISACKTSQELSLYLECLEANDFTHFKLFEVKFEMNPLSV